jgi:tape measure domain-containing protein
VLALNNAMLASGASSADASRGVQQFNQMMSTGTVDLESWKTLQETMPLALQKTAEAMGYTGKTAQRDLYSALKEGEITFDQFTDSLIELGTGTGDLAELAKENSLGIATSFGNLRNAVTKGLANVIAKFDELVEKLTGKTIAQNIDSLKGIINSTFDSIVASMDKLLPIFEWFKNNGDLVIGIVSGIVTAFLGFRAVEGVPKIIEGVKTSLSVLKGVFATLTSPIGLVILAIGALIGVFVYLWRTNEDFKNKVIEIWNAISNFLQPIIETIATFIRETWSALVEWWGTNQQSIFDTVMNVWNGILEFIQPVIAAISEFIMNVWGVISQWWNENQQFILDTATTIWEAIKLVFTTVLGVIQTVVSTVLENIRAFWDQWGTAIMTIVEIAWAYISNAFQGALKNILTIVSTVIAQIQNIFELAMSIIQGVVDIALGIMQGDWDRVLGGIKTIVDGFKTFVTNTFDNLMSMAEDLVSNGIETIKGFFDSLSEINLWDAGKAIIDGFLNGLKSAYENVKNFIGGIGDWIADNKGPISYDLKLLIPAGNAIMDGLNKGLKNRFKEVQKTISDMSGEMKLGMEIGIDKSKFERTIPEIQIPQVQAESILSSRMRGYRGNSQVINNTYNNQRINDLGELIKSIKEQSIVVQAVVDGKSFNKANAPYQSSVSAQRNKYSERGLATDARI